MVVFTVHHHFIDRLAFLNGFISGVALYPQVITVLLSGSAEGVSLTTFSIIFLNSVVWMFYSIHRGLLSLGIASLLNALASIILLLFILVFN